MSFISYNANFIKNELNVLDIVHPNDITVYRAKQLLKMLDDLMDEGYDELSKTIEAEYSGVSRLRKYLADNNAEPFSVSPKVLKEADLKYDEKVIELKNAIDSLYQEANCDSNDYRSSFIKEIISFCEWIGNSEDTAYIFLLRDTLLLYIYFLHKGNSTIHPWLLSRKALSEMGGKENIDDEIRASIFNALESEHCLDFERFCEIVLPNIKETVNNYPQIVSYLTALLNEIDEKHIIVIESGCSGTFPLLLKSLDCRVDFRMYTTYPYLLNIYGDRIFSNKYEHNRMFETLYSQDLYFQFSTFDNNHFYVRQCKDEKVKNEALQEINAMLI